LVTILLATTNLYKIIEIQHFLGLDRYRLITPQQAGINIVVEENGATFSDNARLKAKAFAAKTNLPVLADDSGLVVDALDGAPGVYSARFAGEFATYLENNLLLLDRLSSTPAEKRTAHFITVFCLLDGKGEFLFEGRTDGLILKNMTGSNGFGYDPLFYIPALGKTYAEMDITEKNQYSHRGQALKKLAAFLASGQFDADRNFAH
jgi:XTP/dITP diphosphohydrolase